MADWRIWLTSQLAGSAAIRSIPAYHRSLCRHAYSYFEKIHEVFDRTYYFDQRICTEFLHGFPKLSAIPKRRSFLHQNRYVRIVFFHFYWLSIFLDDYLALMITGELGFDDRMYSSDTVAYYKVAYLIYILFGVIMSIFVTNLLIGKKH